MNQYEPIPDNAIRLEVENMDTRTLLNHVCCPNFLPGKGEPEEEYAAVFFHGEAKEAFRARVDRYAKICGRTPLIAADLEAGAGSFISGCTVFPSVYAMSQLDTDTRISDMGESAAMEGRAAGVNWTFSPCVDILDNPDSPFEGVRAGGNSAARSIRSGKLYFHAVQSNGMAATLKHFPGDGFTSFDQHLTTTENPLSMDEWNQKSGAVFRTLIAEGVMSIMPGHISLPAYDELDPEQQDYPPATLSKRLMTDLLKHELGFRGIIVSDGANMGGFCGFCNKYDAYARFLTSGGDCMIFTQMTPRFYREMEQRIQSGALPVEILQDRARRMLAFRRDVVAMGEHTPVKLEPERWQESARHAAAEALEVIRDRKSQLPLRLKLPRICHLIVARNYTGVAQRDIYDAMTNALSQYGSVTALVDPGPDLMSQLIDDGKFDLVICSIGNIPQYGTGCARLSGPLARNMMGGWMRMGIPCVFVAHYHPFLLNEFRNLIDILINTNGSSKDTVPALMARIFG